MQKEKGIRVANVKGYSTEAVAQLTLALCLELIEHTSRYDSYVKSHQYEKDKVFSFFGYSFHELSTMTWGNCWSRRNRSARCTYCGSIRMSGAVLFYNWTSSG
ncbi:MAG: hypothetical protein ACLUA3_06880 [Catenibacterium sp.]|uniref:hypothetical protein n=1 Tax=Catenibacterium sp. TaxID=2049022 RepID=UPI00399631CE